MGGFTFECFVCSIVDRRRGCCPKAQVPAGKHCLKENCYYYESNSVVCECKSVI